MHKPENKTNRILLLGVGNYLMGDEGVGVHVANRLTDENWPANITVLDGGTGGFHLMGIIEQYDQVILIDATLDGRPAGTIRLLEPRFASDFPRSMSTHDVGLRDVVEALQLTGRLPKLFVITVSVEELQPMTIELSAPVFEAARELAGVLEDLLHSSQEFNKLNFEILQQTLTGASVAAV